MVHLLLLLLLLLLLFFLLLPLLHLASGIPTVATDQPR
jgi:hypothetical protein